MNWSVGQSVGRKKSDYQPTHAMLHPVNPLSPHDFLICCGLVPVQFVVVTFDREVLIFQQFSQPVLFAVYYCHVMVLHVGCPRPQVSEKREAFEQDLQLTDIEGDTVFVAICSDKRLSGLRLSL